MYLFRKLFLFLARSAFFFSSYSSCSACLEFTFFLPAFFFPPVPVLPPGRNVNLAWGDFEVGDLARFAKAPPGALGLRGDDGSMVACLAKAPAIMLPPGLANAGFLDPMAGFLGAVSMASNS